jgi:hypothetical protein
VEVHRRDAGLVGVEDVADIGGVGDVRGAFVVDDDVEVLGPVLGRR